VSNAKQILAAAFEISAADVPDDAGIETFRLWDSLGHLKVIVELESRLGRPVTTEELLDVTDLASLGKLIDSAGSQ
jgi:acyl carrier protein